MSTHNNKRKFEDKAAGAFQFKKLRSHSKAEDSVQLLNLPNEMILQIGKFLPLSELVIHFSFNCSIQSYSDLSPVYMVSIFIF